MLRPTYAFRLVFGTRRGLRSFTANFLAAAGLFSAVVQFVGQLYFHTTFPAPVTVTVITLLSCTIWAIARAYPRSRLEREFHNPGMTVCVEVGDLLEQETHLVIGFTDTFDTSVTEDRIINHTALQGQFLQRCYDGDQRRLDRELAQALARHTPIGVEERGSKRLGKLTRYPVGTVAVLGTPQRHVFGVAYSRMGNDLVPRSSVDELWRSLTNLWEAVYEHGQRQPLSMAIIGSGAARIDQLDRDALLKLILMSFLAHARELPICKDLRVIIHPGDVHALDLLELAAFLRSL
ncbi:macro domain-containing protein [Nonomuraea bangladeshensis]|uniref:macro domain-containing protein n=1 Tax=Nonomuraea bangladeshensis TaxID=404385 RepID=UPI003C2C4B9B